jgi:hypothetical protein
MAIKAAADKKGGVDDLGKLRSRAKRNGTILTFFLLGGVPGFLCTALCGNVF